MPEDKKADGQDGKTPDNAQAGDNSQGGDAGQSGTGKQISKESWDALLTEKKKEQEEKRKLQAKLDKIEADQKKAEEEKLKADGKLQELLTAKEKDLEARTERVRKAELKAAAIRAGMLDMEYVGILMGAAKFNDQDELENSDELFKDLREKKPYLFQQPETPPPPGMNNAGANWKTGHVFTESEVMAMTDKERLENWPEILKQMGEGRIK